MNKEKALQRLSALEKEASELRKIITHPETSNIDKARQWLVDLLNENDGKFEIQVKKDAHTYYRNGQWLFQLDLENKNLWVYYYSIWSILEKEYSLNCDGVKKLIKDVVGEAFNCKDFTPSPS